MGSHHLQVHPEGNRRGVVDPAVDQAPGPAWPAGRDRIGHPEPHLRPGLPAYYAHEEQRVRADRTEMPDRGERMAERDELEASGSRIPAELSTSFALVMPRRLMVRGP